MKTNSRLTPLAHRVSVAERKLRNTLEQVKLSKRNREVTTRIEDELNNISLALHELAEFIP